MTKKIFIATSSPTWYGLPIPGYKHLYLVLDDDGNASTINDQHIITGGPYEGVGPNDDNLKVRIDDLRWYNPSTSQYEYIMGELAFDVGETSVTRNYTELDIDSSDVQDVWDSMINFVDSLGTGLVGYVDTEIEYNFLSYNSNSVISSILASQGLSIADNIPVSSSYTPGIEYVYGGEDDDKLSVDFSTRYLDGREGEDTVILNVDWAYVRVNLAEDNMYMSTQYGFNAGWRDGEIRNVENITGIEYNSINPHVEYIIGNDGDNKLDGRGGNDVLFGGGGNDTFYWGLSHLGQTHIRDGNVGDTINLVGVTTNDISGFWDHGYFMFWIDSQSSYSQKFITDPAYLWINNSDPENGFIQFKNPNGSFVSIDEIAVSKSYYDHSYGWGGGWGGVRAGEAASPGNGYAPAEVADKPKFIVVPTEYTPTIYSPLIIDLDDDGLELTNLNSNPVYWDVDNDGIREASAWVSADDALLVMDWNDNGFIDNHSELFGTKTIDGFTKLTELDSNTDGVINSSDSAFENLQIWQDLNQDGISQFDELLSLTTAGIVSISLSDGSIYDVIEGNEVTLISTVTMSDTSTRDIFDAWFEVDNQNTIYDQFIVIDSDTLFLPHLRGYGNINDLDIQMTLDSAFLEQVGSLSEITIEDVLDPTNNFDDQFRSMLYRWDGLSDRPNVSNSPHEDDRKVQFISDVVGVDLPEWLGLYQAIYFRDEGLWEKMVTHYMANFLFQTVLHDLFEGGATYNAYAGIIEGATSLSSTALDDIANLIDGTDDPSYGWSIIVRTVEEAIGIDNLDSGDYDLLDDAIQNSVPGLDLDTIYNLIIGDPNNVVGTSSNETLTGTFADDQLDGQSGNDTLEGGRGDDHLYGSYGDDTYIGGSGDDFLDERSGSGNDIYVYDSGHDLIQSELSGTDIIALADGIVLGDISIERVNPTDPSSANLNGQTDLIIHVAGYGDITIGNQYGYYGNVQGIETLQFYSMSTIDLTDLDNVVYGTSGNDTITGTDNSYYLRDIIDASYGDDIIDGGLGNDVLYGSVGDDTYLVGQGVDWIQEGTGTDEIVFDNTYDPGLFTFGFDPLLSTYTPASMALKVYYDGELKVIIDQQFAYGSNYFVEKLVIDGVDEINLATQDWDQYGTSGNDSMYAIQADAILNAVYGMAGDDSITGSAKNDTLHGGDGVDSIQGNDGNDLIYGDDGNDSIDGGFGHDTVYGGEGNDYIVDAYAGNDIIHGGNGNDTISGDYGFAYAASNDTLYGDDGNDNLSGGTGTDTLSGGAGTDTLEGGAGADVFLFETNTLGSVDTVSDFNTGQGDALNIADLLTGYTSGVSDINDFCSVVDSGGNTLFSVDRDGAGSTYSSTQIATLSGVTGLDVDTLLLNNNLIAA